jgi:GAF domain-containing protein
MTQRPESEPPIHASADVDDLRASLAQLARLTADTLRLDELLGRVAEYAVHGIPGAEGAGVTLLRLNRPDDRVVALAASVPFVRGIEELYVDVGEGPCITAVLDRRTVRSGSLGGERLWPRFGPRAARLGVHSVLSMPLLLPGEVVGAINVYAHAKDAFTDRAAELGELFAAPAAVTVHNAQALAQAQARAVQLETALSTRPVVDRAVGIILARTGGSAEEALARLRAISQAEHRKVVDVARRIVDEAVRRARARHTGPDL